MNVARVAVLGIAGVAGLGAAVLVGSGGGAPPPPQEVVQQVQVQRSPTTEVLVAVREIPIGGTLTRESIDWRPWPDEALGQQMIRRTSNPEALEQTVGAITRSPLAAGEPVNQSRIIIGQRGGFMAAMLPQGMRAVAIQIQPETGAGGFILPNDRVDVMLTRRDRGPAGETFLAETILTNIRVMAIDQTIQERDGERVVVGRVATLEVTPRQGETVALARQLGELSLALRSIQDNTPAAANATDLNQRGGTVTIVRFGVPVQVPVFNR